MFNKININKHIYNHNYVYNLFIIQVICIYYYNNINVIVILIIFLKLL